MRLVNNLVFNGNQAIGIIFQHLASDPGTPTQGQAWFNTTQKRFKYFDGDVVHSLAQTAEGVLSGISGSGAINAVDNGDGTYTISIDPATTTDPGSMSATDKAKLDTAPSDIGAAIDAKLDASQKGAANGVATLDGNSKIPSAQLPPIAIGEVHVVADNTARDALTVEEGDVAKVTGTGITWIYDGTDWVEMTATSAVDTVNGQTGDVSITAAGLGALEASQNLSDVADAGTARDNLGLGTAAVLDAPASGDAAAGEVVLGDDTRLVPAMRFSADVGDGSSTQIDVTHNLGTRDVLVQVREASSPWAKVEPDIEMLSTTQVRLRFAVAPTSGQYRVTVLA